MMLIGFTNNKRERILKRLQCFVLMSEDELSQVNWIKLYEKLCAANLFAFAF